MLSLVGVQRWSCTRTFAGDVRAGLNRPKAPAVARFAVLHEFPSSGEAGKDCAINAVRELPEWCASDVTRVRLFFVTPFQANARDNELAIFDGQLGPRKGAVPSALRRENLPWLAAQIDLALALV